MNTLYPYTFTSDGEGPWWGIRCPRSMYQSMILKMQETTRCFVYLTNSKGETLAVAVEGPHNEEGVSAIFAPNWVFTRLEVEEGSEVLVDQILEKLPSAESVRIRPMTMSTVQGPMFLEGLTEALNQLGIVQEGLLSAIVDPSLPHLHQFIIEGLTPARVCLADGELNVDLEAAVDCPIAPVPAPEEPIDFNTVYEPPLEAAKGFTAFGGKGYRLDGK